MGAILKDQILCDQIIKILIASLVGSIIGFERTKRDKPAGLATYSIICITSCFLTVISTEGFAKYGADPTRLISNIITAIGFVAGGVIFTDRDHNKNIKVTGITTGATIFCVASLGIGIGLGSHFLVLFVVSLIELNIFLAIKLKRYYKIYKDDHDDTDI